MQRFLEATTLGEERNALVAIDPKGFYIRHPPDPHLLDSFITPDAQLFQTIHMGAAVVDESKWILVVDGLVESPFALTLDMLCQFPQDNLTAFHECYGSPLKPPTEAVWRIGNVVWTGVWLSTLLAIAKPLPDAKYVWSEGLDHGNFAGTVSDRYQKDLPLEKAMKSKVMIAHKINGDRLSKERGGPVRLIVPGWFGTNSTKWLCRLSSQKTRAPGHYTTTFYNEADPSSPGKSRPIWDVEINSIIVQPAPDDAFVEDEMIKIEGWCWCHDGVKSVAVSYDDGSSWVDAEVKSRVDFSWQRFVTSIRLRAGSFKLMARATSISGVQQPLTGRRNHVHSITIIVKERKD